ncbi:SpoIIE family protein phosphatase [Streptomyces sp. NPDC001868]|uniref:SpoIIE family protein phosphatase n=1 Tax=Streptomyces sp. NPDC001868 TaxID=3154401 RepID=UPI00332AC9F9
MYDPITGHCVLASAGHPGPVLVSRGGAEADMVSVRPGLPLAEGAEPFEATELQLSPGDVLSFYTGALTRDPFHTRGLTVVLLQEPLDDDLALLVTQVRRLPEDATAAWELAADPSIVAGIRRQVADQLTS